MWLNANGIYVQGYAQMIGGIFGYNYTDVSHLTISNSLITTSDTTNTSYNRVGGIIGYEDQNQNKKFFYKWDGEGLRYEIQEWMSCILNHRFESARLRRCESIAMARVMEQFAKRENFFEI